MVADVFRLRCHILSTNRIDLLFPFALLPKSDVFKRMLPLDMLRDNGITNREYKLSNSEQNNKNFR